MITEFEMRSLQKKLELMAGFRIGAERFSFSVNPNSDKSWWNFKVHTIHVGIKDIPKKKVDLLSELLMEHETGHVIDTSRRIDYKTLSYPFSLLNILEDARIESRKEVDFSPLHSYSYKKGYLNSDDAAVFSNPYNIGVLLRWKRSGLETKVEKPEILTDDQFDEFLSDWNRYIDSSIEAASTERVSYYAGELYEKWKHLFDSSRESGKGFAGTGKDGEPIPAGSIEKSAEDMLGEGESEDSDSEGCDDFAQGLSSTEVKDIAHHFEEKWFEWDMGYIQSQVNTLRRLLEITAKTEKEYKYHGRRIDILRLHRTPPLPPFKTKVESKSTNSLKKLLIVIDGSGSMSGEPFKNAAHLAYILSSVFPSDIKITTTYSSKPINVPVKHIGLLRGYTSWGGGENYISLGTDAVGYFTLFLTDACVAPQDIGYVKDTLNRITKLGAGYVGGQNHRLNEVFPRNFYSEGMNQDIAKMVALFLKRYFIRQLAA